MADDFEAPAAPPDDYERRYMEGDRAVLRARQRQPRWLPLTMLGIMAVALVQFWGLLAWLWDHLDAPGAVTTLALLGAWITLNVVVMIFGLLVEHVTRVVLTPTHLHVHRGLKSQDIPLDAITAVTAEAAGWKGPPVTLRGGLLRREHAYVTFGTKHMLLVEWRDAKGRARKTWVQFDGAPAFRARIEALRGGATGVRVAEEVQKGERAESEEGEQVEEGGRTKVRGG